MGQTTLVGQEIDAGQELLTQLAREHFDVTAAGWIRSEERPRWHFYIASKEVEEHGWREAVMKIHEQFRRMPDLWIDSSDVNLIGATDPVARDMAAFRSHYSAKRPIRFGGPRLGNLNVDEAFLYPPPSPRDAPADPVDAP